MKRTTLSLFSLAALASAGAAHAQTSVTLYGTIDTSLTYVHNAAGDKNLWALGNSSSGNLSGTRWGIKGTEDLGAGLKAIFQLENGFDPSTGKLNQGGRMFGRQAFVGLAHDTYGSVTLGRQYDPLIDLVQGITEDNYFGSAFATAGDVDNYDNSFRVNNAIKYTSPVWSGLQFAVMYSLGGVAGATGSEQSYSAAAAYNNGPISLAAGYFYASNSPASAGLRDPAAGTARSTARSTSATRPRTRSASPAWQASMWPARSRSARPTATRNIAVTAARCSVPTKSTTPVRVLLTIRPPVPCCSASAIATRSRMATRRPRTIRFRSAPTIRFRSAPTCT